MAWQKDVQYSDVRHGTQKILTFPDVIVGGASAVGIQGRITFNEDIRIQEVGAYPTTIVATGPAVTILLTETAGDVTLATITMATGGSNSVAVGVETNQTTITNATAIVSGTTMVITNGVTADSTGIVTVYVKYLSEFN